ncbi:MAG: esterase [Legionella sp. 40-6]|nr:YbgC/FadM family acyl-CoA thioesterase [Legionella sp.]OJY39322.1 MAG: esterase [Legionella sp. 40-6]
MKQHDQVYQHTLRIYAEDVDYMGIVYHANYLTYFERARTEMLRAHQVVLSELHKADTLFAISELNIRYLAPARLDDLLTVTTKIKDSSACRFIFQQNIHNEQGQEICSAQITVVAVNSELRPKRFKID